MRLITRMYRARLGVGTSREVKKLPVMRFSPIFGLRKVECCQKPRIPKRIIDGGTPSSIATSILNGGNPSSTSSNILNGGTV